SENEYEDKPTPAPAPQPASEPAPAAAFAKAEEEQEDAEAIVDPLAGLRSEIAESRSGGEAPGEGMTEPADDSDHAVVGGGFTRQDAGQGEPQSRKEPLDLTSEASTSAPTPASREP